VLNKSIWRKIRRRVTIMYVVTNIILVVIFIASVIEGSRVLKLQPLTKPRVEEIWFADARQIFIAILFLVLVVLLSYYGMKVRQLMSDTNQIPQIQSISRRTITISTALIFIIFTSRSMYDILTVIQPSIQLHFGGTNKWFEELLASVLYFIWEIIPTLMVLTLFWRIPRSTKRNSSLVSYPFSRSINNDLPADHLLSHPKYLAHLFQDPKRYDSDEEQQLFTNLNEPNSPEGESREETLESQDSMSYTPYNSTYNGEFGGEEENSSTEIGDPE